MNVGVISKYRDITYRIDQYIKPKDRRKAKIIVDGLLVGWLAIFGLFIFSFNNPPILLKSGWMLLILTIAIFQMLSFRHWILSIHIVTIGILLIIVYELFHPGFTPDILLIQHAFLVIFFSQVVIMDIWGNIYTIVTIINVGIVLLQRQIVFSFRAQDDWANYYIILICFGIILYMMFKNLQVLRSLILDIESSRDTETILYKEIKREAEKAAFQNDKKTLFFSTISHELRTPLNAIVGFSNLLKSDFEETDIPENLKLLHFSTEYLASTINNVMESSNNANYINSASSESSFDLIDLVFNVYKGLKIKADKKDVTLEFDYSPDLEHLSVIGLMDRLTQVIYNLTDNAIKFTRKGKVCIGVYFVKRIHSHVVVEFRISDTGIGIAADKIKDIFKPYHQASDNIHREFGGTGLGLTIVDKLLRMMKSQVQCESKIGEGTTFSFEIPFLIPNYRSTHNLSEIGIKDNSLFKNLNILVAEDNELNLKLISKVLETWEVNFDLALDGWEAVEKVGRKKYDVILMDVNMPRMTGIESTKLIRKLYPQQTIIFLTANIQQEVVDEMKSLKVFGYLIKPFKVEDLRALIYKTLI